MFIDVLKYSVESEAGNDYVEHRGGEEQIEG